MIEILDTGPLSTVQDLGRPGHAALGVTRSGAADRAALTLANRLVGNSEHAAALEVTLGGVVLRLHDAATVALAGAPLAADASGRALPFQAAVSLPAGVVLTLRAPAVGLRTYLAVRGVLVVAPVLGSRSTDVLSGLGPPRCAAGMLLPIGHLDVGEPSEVEPVPTVVASSGGVVRVMPGPRLDWFDETTLSLLCGSTFTVAADSDRVGVRLAGAVLPRVRQDELPSEGMVPGAVQVPPDGQPVVFLADYPVTGGYPVIAVVLGRDLSRLAQARPGDAIRFRPVG